ncbi:MAG TPA: TRZ/ATZ family hydrolase [Pseudomonadales bacterium]|nr:TRZ/ATZ family hydrolase [Pseudomonadales bacterium]
MKLESNFVDLIIHAACIITLEDDRPLLHQHALVIDRGRIIDIIPSEQSTRYSAKTSIHRPQHALLPGLINAHGHSAMTLFRGLADDLPLMDWLNHHIWPAEQRWVDVDFVAHGVQLAIIEMLRSGTTTFCDQYFFPEVSAAVAKRNHMRCRLNTPILDFPSTWAQSADEYIDKGLNLFTQYRHDSLISTALGPHAPYTVSDGPLQKIQQVADQHNMCIHMHVNETAHEVGESLKHHGKRPIERLQALGVLSPRFQAVHMTQISEIEIKLLQQSGAHVIHCPESNLKLASGLCPVQRLLEAGINVALGTDGAASNNDLDMISELRSASLIAKLVDHDPRALPALNSLKLASLNGAKALGLDQDIGSIRLGKQADLITIDLSAPELQPLYNPISQIVYSAGRQHVSDVWVAGKHLMDQRQLQFINEQDVLLETLAWQKKIAAFQ